MVQNIFELLFDEIADHPRRFRSQNVQRITILGRVLKRKQTDLRPVAMRDHQPVPST